MLRAKAWPGGSALLGLPMQLDALRGNCLANPWASHLERLTDLVTTNLRPAVLFNAIALQPSVCLASLHTRLQITLELLQLFGSSNPLCWEACSTSQKDDNLRPYYEISRLLERERFGLFCAGLLLLKLTWLSSQCKGVLKRLPNRMREPRSNRSAISAQLPHQAAAAAVGLHH